MGLSWFGDECALDLVWVYSGGVDETGCRLFGVHFERFRKVDLDLIWLIFCTEAVLSLSLPLKVKVEFLTCVELCVMEIRHRLWFLTCFRNGHKTFISRKRMFFLFKISHRLRLSIFRQTSIKLLFRFLRINLILNIKRFLNILKIINFLLNFLNFQVYIFAIAELTRFLRFLHSWYSRQRSLM